MLYKKLQHEFTFYAEFCYLYTKRNSTDIEIFWCTYVLQWTFHSHSLWSLPSFPFPTFPNCFPTSHFLLKRGGGQGPCRFRHPQLIKCIVKLFRTNLQIMSWNKFSTAIKLLIDLQLIFDKTLFENRNTYCIHKSW